MKISIRKMFVLLAVVLTLTAVQGAWAGSCDITINGMVTAVNYDDNSITINGDTTVYGVRLPYLANRLNIIISAGYEDTDGEYIDGDFVQVTAYECPASGLLTTCSIKINDGTVINFPKGNRRQF